MSWHSLLQAGPSAAAAAEGVLVDEQTNLLSSAQQQEANLLDLDDDSGPSTSGGSHVPCCGGLDSTDKANGANENLVGTANIACVCPCAWCPQLLCA